jgi:hypothetical protein
VLLAANQLHHPVDRQSRMLVRQLGMLVLINIGLGFTIPNIDNAAHLGGLATGLWLGALLPPTHVQTMTSMWQRARRAASAQTAHVPLIAPVLAVGVVAFAVVVGIVAGTPDHLL